MLRNFGLPLIALAGMLMFAAPRPASAQAGFGVTVGPAYPGPYSYYCSPYDDPYNCPAYAHP